MIPIPTGAVVPDPTFAMSIPIGNLFGPCAICAGVAVIGVLAALLVALVTESFSTTRQRRVGREAPASLPSSVSHAA
jgi:hypothetical protein